MLWSTPGWLAEWLEIANGQWLAASRTVAPAAISPVVEPSDTGVQLQLAAHVAVGVAEQVVEAVQRMTDAERVRQRGLAVHRQPEPLAAVGEGGQTLVVVGHRARPSGAVDDAPQLQHLGDRGDPVGVDHRPPACRSGRRLAARSRIFWRAWVARRPLGA